ncbi:MAG: YdcF family protein [Ferruginibacter sp.]
MVSISFFSTFTKRRYSLFFSSLLSMFIFSSCFYSNKAAQKLYDAAATNSYDMVVVPGVPFNGGKWDKTMKGRVYWSKFLYDKGIAKNLMYSGSSVYTPYYEGMIMAMYAIELGIPAEHVFYEITAEHSTENIYYSYKKAKQLGFDKIALASDKFQTMSLRKFTRKKVSPDVAMLPMVTDTMNMLEPTMIDPVIDSKKAFNKDFISIKKREGFFKRLRGTMGRNIEK